MTTSMPSIPITSQYGDLLYDDAGTPLRYAWIVFGALAVWGVLASLFQGSFAGFVFWGLVGAGCFGYFYVALRGVHAQLYEQGFLITRGGKTTSARWDEIAKVEHWIKTTRYAFIPVSKSHSYKVILTDGEQIKIAWWFKSEKKLGAIFERMWAAAAAKRSQKLQEGNAG